MKIHILFERDPNDGGVCWAIDAVDEYTCEEHRGAYPSDFQIKLDVQDGNDRAVLIVEVPENIDKRLWPEPPVVHGEITWPKS